MNDRSVISALAAARQSETPLAELPEPVPPALDRAFRLQGEVSQALGWRQIGWKIGCTSLRAQKALNAPGPFPGTMFANRLFRSGDHVPTIAVNRRVVEPEVAFTMASALPPRGRDYDPSEVLAAIASVHAAVEVVNPRTPRGFADPVPWFIVDGGLNDSLVLGAAQKPLAIDTYGSLRAEVEANDKPMGQGVGANALGGGHLALTWLANHLCGQGKGLGEGDIVTTGVITEFFSAALGDRIAARFEGLGAVTLSF
ncbi:MAG: hypothetical protein FJX63_01720 [Alphaproteobacteria bacterium]|nr:hypothetical protein [Alphaproteobacteria bacterium]